MSKFLEVLELLDRRQTVTNLSEALELARAIDAIYTPATPESWAKANVSQFYADRKIQFIKDIRAAIPGTSLVDAKNAAEAAVSDWSLARLREKLTGSAPEPLWEPDEDRAYAEHRERMAENGTWFGVPGPMDEEPF